jgi:hypothetical protein
LPERALASFDDDTTIPAEALLPASFWEMSAEFALPLWQQVPSQDSLQFGEGFESALRSQWGMRGFFLRSEFNFVPSKSLGTVEALHFGDVTALGEGFSFGLTAGRFALLSPVPFMTLLGPGGFLKSHSVDGAALFLDLSNFRIWGAASSSLPGTNEFYNTPGFTGLQSGNGAGAVGVNFDSPFVTLGLAAGYEPKPYGSFLTPEMKPVRKPLAKPLTIFESDAVLNVFQDLKFGIIHQQQWDLNVERVEISETNDQYLFQKTMRRTGLGLSWMILAQEPHLVLSWTGSHSTDAAQVNAWESSTDVTLGAGPFSLTFAALNEKADRARYFRKLNDPNVYYQQSVYKIELKVLIKETSER